MALSGGDLQAGSLIADAILDRLSVGPRPLVVGLCGAQGSGKSTAAADIEARLAAAGVISATLALDDLVLARPARLALARVHPLLATRGPPGTHEVELGLAILAALRAGEPATLPRLDKLADDRAPPQENRTAPAGVDVVIFEGWCVGALPQHPDALKDPVNALERSADADGRWRAYINQALAGDYQRLFGQIDMLVLLKAPGFGVVGRWRLEQERANLAQRPGGMGGMDREAVERFVQFYERLTRHILAEMPARADLVLELDDDRAVTRVIRQNRL